MPDAAKDVYAIYDTLKKRAWESATRPNRRKVHRLVSPHGPAG